VSGKSIEGVIIKLSMEVILSLSSIFFSSSKVDINNLLPKCLAGQKISAKSQLPEIFAANK